MKDNDHMKTSSETEYCATENPQGEYIRHVKNRYTLDCTLKNHAKRSNRHMWEITLLIKSDGDALPVFQNIKINERRNAVIRAGEISKQEKKRSQIICDGELILNERVSPFVLDLILDIAYVSTTKCENVNIKIRKTERSGEYTVLNCQLYVY